MWITRQSKASRRAAMQESVTLAVSETIHVPWFIAFASLNAGVGQAVSVATIYVESSRGFHSASLVQLSIAVWVYWKMSQKISVQVSRRINSKLTKVSNLFINSKLTKDSNLFSERKITGSLINHRLERKRTVLTERLTLLVLEGETSRRKSLTGQT
jgi:hypothetical protein